MKIEIENLWNKIVNSNGTDRIKCFILYCEKLVEMKENGSLTEEQSAYKIVNAMRFDDICDIEICDEILDLAGTVEKPRTLSYCQPIGKWDARTADQIKQKEWKLLVEAIGRAGKCLI